MANPTLLDMPIARDGNKNAIPTTDNGTTGLLSQQYGWQLINAIPPQQGGKAVKREDFNGALYLLSNLLFYLQKGWQFEWDANQNYYAGCIVKDPNDGKMYQRLNDGTSNTAPHSDNTNWKLWDLSAYLPLEGGAMTGHQITRNRDDSSLNLYGATAWEKGSLITLWGGDSSANGRIDIVARKNSKDYCSLNAYVNGTLTWDGDDLGGNAIVAKSIGANGYVKRADGEIMQWGLEYEVTSAGATIQFPISFPNNNARVVISPYYYTDSPLTPSGTFVFLENVTGSSFTVKSNTSDYVRVSWMAIGS